MNTSAHKENISSVEDNDDMGFYCSNKKKPGKTSLPKLK